MGKESDLDRRKSMEGGIFAITERIGAVSNAMLARFAVEPLLIKGGL